MIRRLQYRFISVAMGSLLLVMLIVLGTINFVNFYTVTRNVYSKLEYLTENNSEIRSGTISSNFINSVWTDEFPYETRYFTVVISKDREVAGIDLDHIAAVDSKNALKLVETVSLRSGTYGKITTLRHTYAYHKAVLADDNEIVVFLDCTEDFNTARNVMTLCMTIGLISYVAVFILVSIASKNVVQPVIDNIEKQKQFITNAGHELKTPLAIISANTEVLEMMSGENEWTKSTMNQIKRLSALVNNLIRLARMEESGENLVIKEFNISELTEEIAESFVAVAEKDGKKITKKIAENVEILSDKNFVQELISILIDNAVKYCDPSGEINITLQQLMKSVRITVTNDYAEGENIDCRRFFDRFYRADTSHNSVKSGYGIGLSMAQEIVSLIKGRISADWKKGKISFMVIIPIK